MARIPLFTPDSMSAEQAEVYANVVNGPRGKLVGPLRAAMHRPELAERWQQFGEILRFGTTLPSRITELAILVTARRWNSQLEWHIHVQSGLKAGLSESTLESLRIGEVPVFEDADEADAYQFARELQLTGNVSEAVYQRLLASWGTVGIVELSSVIGYYTLVSMTLNVHDIPLPEGAVPPLQPIPHCIEGAPIGDLALLPTLPAGRVK